MLIASTISSAAMGSEIFSAEVVKSLVWEQGGTPEASVWFDTGRKVPVANAARVNAVMSDAAASDDSDLRNIVHPGTNLVATSLAMAEKIRSSGQDVSFAKLSAKNIEDSLQAIHDFHSAKDVTEIIDLLK
jgi:2-methylcitrate dehydratase PrpD